MDNRKKIVLGEGTDYERILWIDRPKGKVARQKMPEVLAFAAKLQDLKLDEKNDLGSVLNLVDTFWGRDEFENDLLPYVLGLDNQEGREYLDKNCTMVELMDAFNAAAGWLIEQSFSRQEVQTALGKSTEEAPVEAPVKKTRSQNTD